MAAIDNLNANVTKVSVTADAVLTLVTTLQGQAGTPEAPIQAAADAIDAVNTKLAAILPPTPPVV